jgi:PAS domain S-box-containing protein
MAPTAGGFAVGGDAELALAGIPVPSYVLDTEGVVRWINPAAERLLGDVRGRHFTSVVGPEDRARAKELFARKVLGTTAATETSGVFVSTDGTRVALEVSAVPLMGGERVVGVFGLLTGPLEEASTPPAHLTPRQAEVLRLLEQGRSTKQIAQELHLSRETVKNHVRHLLRALGVHSRLEAVAVARQAGPPKHAQVSDETKHPTDGGGGSAPVMVAN